MLLRDNSSRTPENDTLDPSMFEDLTKNDLENGVKGKYFQESDYFTNILGRNELQWVLQIRDSSFFEKMGKIREF